MPENTKNHKGQTSALLTNNSLILCVTNIYNVSILTLHTLNIA